MSSGSDDDWYAVLGVDAAADAAELRRAWRRLARLWHPDRAGACAKAKFQRLQAAYAVLTDPVARAAYDRRRGLRARRSAAPEPAGAPKPAAAVRARAPAVMLERLSGSLNTLVALGVAQRADDDVIELFLTPQEMAAGGMATISMRVPVRCPACGGRDAGPCARCGTTRTVDELFSAWLAVPPGVAEGAVLHPSAQLPGTVRPVSFRVRRDEA